MDGLLIIDKPEGITSHDVVSRVRRILGTKRVGHTGTLDPFATGVMVILVGNATRIARFIDKDEKEYEAVVRFGFETDTGDLSGSPIADCGLRNEEVAAKLHTIDWESVLEKWRGDTLQTPPMYSAKKVAGKKLYELAREGKEVARKPVPVSIHKLELFTMEIRNPKSQIPNPDDGVVLSRRHDNDSGISTQENHPTIRIRVACSAGTYIRTLAEDIGREVGLGAHLAALRRTRSGKFTIQEAVTLSDLETMTEPASCLRPLTEAVAHLPAVTLPADRVEKSKNGLASRISSNGFADGAAVRMLDEEAILIAIGTYIAEEKSVKPKIVLV